VGRTTRAGLHVAVLFPFSGTGLIIAARKTPFALAGRQFPNSHPGRGRLSPKEQFLLYRRGGRIIPVFHRVPHCNWPGQEGQEIDVGNAQQLRRTWNSS